ncbi:MAG TPA: rhodanese-like domain-containing protein [Lacunisphaera sp.]|jgi:rhodanese-related sulfurtransferase|nr:rhodanese-like domain-containing protein [Lacunisphaera sp.]
MNPKQLLKSLFTSAPRLAPADCAHRVRSGAAVLIDVREPGEWSAGVAHAAKLLPLSDLTGARHHWRPFLAEAKDREVLLYCASGARSGMAARMLVAEGVRAANTGGLAAWLDAGWPIAQPSPRTRVH